MGFLRRKPEPAATPVQPAVTGPLVPTYHDQPTRLVVVFDRLPSFDQGRLRRALVELDPRLADVRAEIVSEALEATTHGLVGWGADEVVHVDGSAKAPEAAILDDILRNAVLDAALVKRVRSAGGHVVLTYLGRTDRPDVRFLALASVAAAIASLPGALVVGNRDGQTAIAATRMRKAASHGLAGLRELPRLSLAAGVGVFTVPGRIGTWVRSFGAPRLGLPDLARRANGPEDRAEISQLFTAIHDYIASSGATIRPGDRLEFGETRLAARAPRDDETWLGSTGDLLVLDDRHD